jgi:tRNA pseudouridine55 synthase
MRRGPRSSTTGILIVDKPLGLTSMSVIRVVRRRAGNARTGHAGTLDPLATGVLVVCLGKATKVISRIMDTSKRYTAEVDLSAFSNTDDLEGEIEPVEVEKPPSRAAVDVAASGFVGEIDQTPPVFSAIQIDGRRAYHLARQGREVEMKSRKIVIHSIDVLAYEWPVVKLDICCGKGTYIRSLARDLGRMLGTGGHLVGLRRTAVGQFTIDQSVHLDDVPDPLEERHLLAIDALKT